MNAAVRISSVLSLLLLALAAPAGAQGVPAAAAVRARVDSLARAYVAEHGSPGVSIQLVRGSDTLVSAGYGLADVEQRVPATAATVYRIGSVTKQFTAAAVMRLVEQGKVSLEDSIARYLPGLPAAWRRVTVRQLLNHTSGIPSYTDIGEPWVRRWREDMPPDTLVALTAHDSLWFEPGSQWRYDNTGYVLLGMLLDRVTGTPYPEYVEREIARPLGLEHVYYCDTERVIPGRAHGYDRDAAGWRNAPFLSMTQPYSAGALCSTVGDLARWNRLLAGGKVVSPASYAAMTTPTGAARQARYGFGLGVDSLEGHPMITHNGGIHGFASDNAVLPADSLSVTVLTNAGSGHPDLLLKNVARAALGLPIEQTPPRVSLTAAERARYAGRYEIHLPDGKLLPVTITAGEDALMIQPKGQPATELIPIGDHVFRADFDATLRVTFHLEGDHATGFTLLQGGATMEAPRVE
jgi:CubicO group peptidase (beta-lactamase class C family)